MITQREIKYIKDKLCQMCFCKHHTCKQCGLRTETQNKRFCRNETVRDELMKDLTE